MNQTERNYDWKITRGVLMRTRLPGIHVFGSRAMLDFAAALLALGVAVLLLLHRAAHFYSRTHAHLSTESKVHPVVATEVLGPASTRAFVILEEILEELGPRESATNQESEATRYLQTKLQDLGYETEIQQLLVEHVSLAGMGLTLITPQPLEFAASAFDESGLGDVSGSSRRSAWPHPVTSLKSDLKAVSPSPSGAS